MQLGIFDMDHLIKTIDLPLDTGSDHSRYLRTVGIPFHHLLRCKITDKLVWAQYMSCSNFRCSLPATKQRRKVNDIFKVITIKKNKQYLSLTII